MHVEEKARVTACEVRQVSFRHGADVASDVFGQVLVVVFLTRDSVLDARRNVGCLCYAPCSEAHGGGPAPIVRHIS
jgi:hypothetical protein